MKTYSLNALTNYSNQTVNAQMKNADLERCLDDQFSVEDIGVYKHLRVYRWAAHKAGVDVDDCMLIAAHGWDVAGALWTGMRAAFIARPGQSLYPLAPVPEISVPDFAKLTDKLLA